MSFEIYEIYAIAREYLIFLGNFYILKVTSNEGIAKINLEIPHCQRLVLEALIMTRAQF
jgi:hypothetical protein